MLVLKIPAVAEFWDEINEEFIYSEEVTLHLEHSLVAVSKWESKWHKFFFKDDKTDEEVIDYIRCMTLDDDVDPDVYQRLTPEDFDEINKYIGDPMTATILPKTEERGRKETVSSELIYYYMFVCGIPEACAHWHIARLITLIGVFGVKNAPKKKRSQADLINRHRALNEARKKQLHTKG